MASTIKVDTIENIAGSGNVSLGSGHNLVVPGNITGQGTAAITSNATVGGTLGVTGKITSTAGITFGSDTASTNVLADYEEGTWTPVGSDANTGGNTSGGTTAQGRYVKVGKIITAWGTINNITTSGMTSSNTFYVQGLPYVANNAPTLAAFTGSVYYNSISYTNTSANHVCEVFDGDDFVSFRMIVNSTGNASSVTVANLNNNATDIRLTVTYETAA